MARLWIVSGATAVVALVLAVSAAQAGGWATVTLDKPLGEPRAGEMIDVGFMVKQHDVTPVHHAFGQPVEPVFIARHQESGDRIESKAEPTKPVGHFVAQVRFPRAGTWLPEVIPAPFAGTKLGPVTVLAPAGSRVGVTPSDESALAQTTIAAPEADSTGQVMDSAGAIGLATIAAVAAAVALIGGHRMLGRRARRAE
jgi:hypothetical protein